ncbi:alpha/beta fold hydrolase, partial [Streptomyces bambusae]
IYARPGRRAPEAVVAETLALREAAGFAQTLAAGTSVRFTADVPGLPVTIAWGSRDRLLLPRQGVRAKRTVPGARLVRLPGCGHVPMNDDPALVARVIRDTAGAAHLTEAAATPGAARTEAGEEAPAVARTEAGAEAPAAARTEAGAQAPAEGRTTPRTASRTTPRTTV